MLRRTISVWVRRLWRRRRIMTRTMCRIMRRRARRRKKSSIPPPLPKPPLPVNPHLVS
jgi:hypothetical protein